MPYLRCSTCEHDQVYSPKLYKPSGCPKCGGDLDFDRPLALDDRPAGSEPPTAVPLEARRLIEAPLRRLKEIGRSSAA